MPENTPQTTYVPFLGAENGRLAITPNSRNGLEVIHEGRGTVCCEANGDFVAGKKFDVVAGPDSNEDSRSSAGQHVDRHILVLSKPLAAAIDIPKEDGRYARITVLVDIADDAEGVERARFVARDRWEASKAPKPPCTRSILGITCHRKEGAGHEGLCEGSFRAQSGSDVALHWGTKGAT